MRKAVVLVVFLKLCAARLALECRVVPGSLTQIDVGSGQVFGVDSKGGIYTLYSTGWTNLRGSLQHVSVGPAGVWGVNSDNNTYKLVGGDWVIVLGKLKQVDAGGMISPAGVMNNDVYCLPSGQGSGWVNIPGKLKYYSCGPYSCWGVDPADKIYIMKGVTPTNCAGSLNWEMVSGHLNMIEVSTDGKVYGVSSSGDIYTRDGISSTSLAGTGWRQIQFPLKVRHASYDLGHLWLIGQDHSIMDCTEIEE